MHCIPLSQDEYERFVKSTQRKCPSLSWSVSPIHTYRPCPLAPYDCKVCKRSTPVSCHYSRYVHNNHALNITVGLFNFIMVRNLNKRLSFVWFVGFLHTCTRIMRNWMWPMALPHTYIRHVKYLTYLVKINRYVGQALLSIPTDMP